MRVLAEIGAGGVDGQRCVTLVKLVSHTEKLWREESAAVLGWKPLTSACKTRKTGKFSLLHTA